MYLRFIAFALLISICSPSYAQQVGASEVGEPEAATGYEKKKAFTSKKFMISAANPYASWAGKQVMLRGGNAIDAAIAVQLMLTLVEPQSSGIGGGSFLLYWDNKKKVLETYDGRETAPKEANAFLWMKDGKKIPWREAVVGGRSVGVPGTLKVLEMVHKEHGKLPWKDLFKEAKHIAREGFEVSPRLAKLLKLVPHPGLQEFHSSKTYFFPGGRPLEVGYLRRNPALDRTFSGLADSGTDYFYKGELAEKIARTAQNASINPGLLTAADINEYEAKKRDPVCGQYKKYQICGMPPPASGGITVYQILKMLEGFKMEQYKPNQLEALHLFTQASRLAYADRKAYIADTDFTRLPFAALVNKTYLQRRAQEIQIDKSLRFARPGSAYQEAFIQLGQSYDLPNTSHISIVDKEGNAISMTSSVEFAFGSGLMVDGFLLNNQLTDFDFQPGRGGYQALNRVEPRKRPRSAMSPTMVFDEKGQFKLALGSPGGGRIISYVAQTLIGVLDWGLDIQEAINLPKITNRNDYTALEKGTNLEGLQAAFEKMGHRVQVRDLNSGLHGVMRVDGKLVGGADPRREGVAVGD